MVKDGVLKILFIPLSGVVISNLSGIITYNKYSAIQAAGGNLYFVFVSFCIWKGCHWIHLKLRRLYTIKQNPFSKITAIGMASGLYSSVVASVFCFMWMVFSKEEFRWDPINKSIFLSIAAVIFFTLIYEILYLTLERQIDTKIVTRLDNDLGRAELTSLRNTLTPHFIFNSLNTLSHLIGRDSKKADLFNSKLAQVYKYFLLNKDREVISADKEIDFIKNYFALIQIRHDNKLQLHIDLKTENIKDILVVPSALQVLVENVIKHNEFSSDFPLDIYIKTDHDFLVIQNTITQKPVMIDSIKIGLKNLAAQYLLIFGKEIIVEEYKNTFTVKLPVTKKIKPEYV
ncbi:MAG: histidine kinase [Ginsengibacter sp.]